MANIPSFTDTFGRANGAIGASYTTETGSLQIVSNRVRANATGATEYSSLAAGIVSPRQYVKFAVPTYANNTQLLQLYTRYVGGATGNGYAWQFDADLAQLYVLNSYSYDFLNQTACVISAADALLVTSVGAVHTLYKNGAVVISYTDATHSAAGTVAWGVRADTSLANVEVDDFEAGIVTTGFRALRGVGS